MTEQEWLESSEPQSLMKLVMHRTSRRKLRLIAAASCRRIWHLLTDPRCRTAVEVTERYADELADLTEVTEAMNAARAVGRASTVQGGMAAAQAAGTAAWDVERSMASAAWAANQAVGGFQTERNAQAALVRDIIGNPFRPVRADSSWLTGNVFGVATAIYDERAFDQLPILADALEDAGCDHADMLKHCREPAEHVRGCWVLDLCLGRE